MPRIILTGAPGTGKSSILRTLENGGVRCVPEMARAILSEQRAIGGKGTGEQNPSLFVALMADRCQRDFSAFGAEDEPVVFDRGLPDLLTYAEVWALDDTPYRSLCETWRYADKAFICPPWEAIFKNDDERRMPYSDVPEFDASLRRHYERLGYELVDVPKLPVEDRAKFILREL